MNGWMDGCQQKQKRPSTVNGCVCNYNIPNVDATSKARISFHKSEYPAVSTIQHC